MNLANAARAAPRFYQPYSPRLHPDVLAVALRVPTSVWLPPIMLVAASPHVQTGLARRYPCDPPAALEAHPHARGCPTCLGLSTRRAAAVKRRRHGLPSDAALPRFTSAEPPPPPTSQTQPWPCLQP